MMDWGVMRLPEDTYVWHGVSSSDMQSLGLHHLEYPRLACRVSQHWGSSYASSIYLT